MKTIKCLMLTTVSGLVLLGMGSSYASKYEHTDYAITAGQAVDIALAAVPGRIHELELEREDDIMAWEVELVSSKDGKEYEILINASSGKVIEIEMEDDDDWFFSDDKD